MLEGHKATPCQGVIRARMGKIMSNPMSGTTLNAASKQWASRSNDERYLSIAELKDAVLKRRHESWTSTPSVNDLRMVVQDGLKVEVYDPTYGQRRQLEASHWGFGQLAQYAKAPAAYLRTLPDELVAINLQWGLERNALRPDTLLLAQSNGHNTLRSMTSTSYGRIWDSQVVEAVERINQDGRWKIPAASYATSNPKRATTLYASDRDIFVFLIDDTRPIEVNGEALYRGFYTWNSEVGAATFGLTTFLYRYVCDNRIIWGATDVKELTIKHTGGAPERFAYEGAKYLKQYAYETTRNVVHQIEAATKYEIPQASEKGKVEEWLQNRGFTASIAKNAVESAQVEEGQARSLWDIVNGITAHARTIPNTDDRVTLERQAGKLMNLVS